jgi:hypothetical protein
MTTIESFSSIEVFIIGANAFEQFQFVDQDDLVDLFIVICNL